MSVDINSFLDTNTNKIDEYIENCKKEKAKKLQKEEEEKAAIKIQAIHRGRKGREEADKLQDKKLNEEIEARKAARREKSLPRLDQIDCKDSFYAFFETLRQCLQDGDINVNEKQDLVDLFNNFKYQLSDYGEVFKKKNTIKVSGENIFKKFNETNTEGDLETFYDYFQTFYKDLYKKCGFKGFDLEDKIKIIFVCQKNKDNIEKNLKILEEAKNINDKIGSSDVYGAIKDLMSENCLMLDKGPRKEIMEKLYEKVIELDKKRIDEEIQGEEEEGLEEIKKKMQWKYELEIDAIDNFDHYYIRRLKHGMFCFGDKDTEASNANCKITIKKARGIIFGTYYDFFNDIYNNEIKKVEEIYSLTKRLDKEIDEEDEAERKKKEEEDRKKREEDEARKKKEDEERKKKEEEKRKKREEIPCEERGNLKKHNGWMPLANTELGKNAKKFCIENENCTTKPNKSKGKKLRYKCVKKEKEPDPIDDEEEEEEKEEESVSVSEEEERLKELEELKKEIEEKNRQLKEKQDKILKQELEKEEEKNIHDKKIKNLKIKQLEQLEDEKKELEAEYNKKLEEMGNETHEKLQKKEKQLEEVRKEVEKKRKEYEQKEKDMENLMKEKEREMESANEKEEEKLKKQKEELEKQRNDLKNKEAKEKEEQEKKEKKLEEEKKKLEQKQIEILEKQSKHTEELKELKEERKKAEDREAEERRQKRKLAQKKFNENKGKLVEDAINKLSTKPMDNIKIETLESYPKLHEKIKKFLVFKENELIKASYAKFYSDNITMNNEKLVETLKLIPGQPFLGIEGLLIGGFGSEVKKEEELILADVKDKVRKFIKDNAEYIFDPSKHHKLSVKEYLNTL